MLASWKIYLVEVVAPLVEGLGPFVEGVAEELVVPSAVAMPVKLFSMLRLRRIVGSFQTEPVLQGEVVPIAVELFVVAVEYLLGI